MVLIVPCKHSDLLAIGPRVDDDVTIKLHRCALLVGRTMRLETLHICTLQAFKDAR